MGKYSKKQQKKKKNMRPVWKVVLALVLGALVVCAVAIGFSRNTTEEKTPVKELLVQSIQEQEDTVLVETTYGTVKYSAAFSEIIDVKAETFPDHAVLTFHVVMDEAVEKLYALYFNADEGVPVGTLEVDGEVYVVTSQFYDAKNLSEENMITFYAAQETINDVLISLSENEGFAELRD